MSSTWKDLTGHREKVFAALMQAGFHPIAMEHFAAVGRPPLEVCLQMLEQTDVYIGIIGRRYGSRPPRYKKSYTWAEYDHARRKGIPTSIFLMANEHSLTIDQVDTGVDAVALQDFIQHLQRHNTPCYFKSPDHLATSVVTTLGSLFPSAGTGPLAVEDPSKRIEDSIARFRECSTILLQWPQTLIDGTWIDRPELDTLESRFQSCDRSLTVLLGAPGSGKSALLSRVAVRASDAGFLVLGIKADYLPTDIGTGDELARALGFADRVERVIAQIVDQKRVLLLIDQLDAVADLADLRSGRLNAILGLIRACKDLPRVHILCSCREFDFKHDTRLISLEASEMKLLLPNWDMVSTAIEGAGIQGAEHWPEQFHEILRTPQHLDIFLRRHEDTGRADAFDSYTALLDDLWARQISTAPRRAVIDLLTQHSLEQESHWIPIAQMEAHDHTIDELLANGVLERHGLRIGFRHQTMLEHARARLFTKENHSLSAFVVTRQDALFVRPMLWSTLSYVRDASGDKYQREVANLFQAGLRLHLRYLLIDFLGQVRDPEQREIGLLAERLGNTEDRKRVLLAIRGHKTWFHALRTTHLPLVATWPVSELWPMIGVISDAWAFAPTECMELVDRYFLPDPAKDELTWRMLQDLSEWDEQAVERVCQLVRRAGLGRLWWAEHLASIVSAKAPELAPRVVATALWKGLEDAADEQADGRGRYSSRSPLESGKEWYELSAIADAAPSAFLKALWPWFIAVVQRDYAGVASSVVNLYGGWTAVFEVNKGEERYPIAHAIETAVIQCARAAPQEFVEVTKASWSVERQPVQIMLARGLQAAAAAIPDVALDFLCSDPRRLHLGGYDCGEQFYSCELIKAVAPHLGQESLQRLTHTIARWSQYREPASVDAEQKTWDREARLRLLMSIPDDVRPPELADFIHNELSELPEYGPDLPRRRMGQVVELSPMNKDEMLEASDEAIIDALSRPSEGGLGEWSDAEKCWIRPGGGDAAARQLAELAKEHPRRVIPILHRLMSSGKESVVSRVLSSIADAGITDDEVFGLIRDLASVGPQSEEFRSEAAAVLYKRCTARAGLPQDLCALLEAWLEAPWHEPSADVESNDDDDGGPVSVLWGYERDLINVGRSFWVFEALSMGLLMQEPPACDVWMLALERHLGLFRSERAWRSYCRELRWLTLRKCNRHRACDFIVELLDALPAVRDSVEGARLLADVSSILPQKVTERLLTAVRESHWPRGSQAFAELMTLIALRDPEHRWAEGRVWELLGNGSQGEASAQESILVGITFAAARLWDEPEMRPAAGRLLCRIVPMATERVASAIGTVFWASEDFPADDVTDSLLQTIAENPSVLKGDWISDLIGHLPGLVPHRRHGILAVCRAVLSQCGAQLVASAHELYMAGPHLVNIAMTLQRFDDTRAAGLDLFEELLRLGVGEAYSCLHEIDLRPIPVSRRNPPERRRRRRRR